MLQAASHINSEGFTIYERYSYFTDSNVAADFIVDTLEHLRAMIENMISRLPGISKWAVVDIPFFK